MEPKERVFAATGPVRLATVLAAIPKSERHAMDTYILPATQGRVYFTTTETLLGVVHGVKVLAIYPFKGLAMPNTGGPFRARHSAIVFCDYNNRILFGNTWS